jgi:hypothetical protein
MSKQLIANARVTVTLELDGGGPWGSDCKMDQVYKQAADHAVGTLRRMMQETKVRALIIGEPVVVAVLTEEKR